jgi:hypothetical protein
MISQDEIQPLQIRYFWRDKKRVLQQYTLVDDRGPYFDWVDIPEACWHEPNDFISYSPIVGNFWECRHCGVTISPGDV